MIAFATVPREVPTPPPSPPRPWALESLSHALEVLASKKRPGDLSGSEREEVLETIGMIPFSPTMGWLRRISNSTGADALGWAEVVRDAPSSGFFHLVESDFVVSEEPEYFPQTPAAALTWHDYLAEFHEGLAIEEHDIAVHNWKTADLLRATARRLRLMGFRPDLDSVPDHVEEGVPSWYTHEPDE